MKKDFIGAWRANFFTGLAVLLPAIVSIALISWLFYTVSSITDTLLIFIPRKFTHQNEGEGPLYWYWSLVALLVVVILISVVGLLARHYLGKKIIEWMDASLLRVPLLNKIYGATKQVNEAFTSGNKGSSFKTVVMVEFPRQGMYSIGFLTSEQNNVIENKTRMKMVSVFIPTTPNPTAGFLVLVPANDVTKLDMSVADGIKYIISLGSINPDNIPLPQTKTQL